jgi:hypothetical protein
VDLPLRLDDASASPTTPQGQHQQALITETETKEKLLVEADAYTPAAPNATPPAQPNPAQVNLYDNIERLKLAVDQILPLHGRKVPLAELQKWIGKAS